MTAFWAGMARFCGPQTARGRKRYHGKAAKNTGITARDGPFSDSSQESAGQRGYLTTAATEHSPGARRQAGPAIEVLGTEGERARRRKFKAASATRLRHQAS